MLSTFRLVGFTLWKAAWAFGEDGCAFLAAAVCYFVFFSVFPLMLVLVAVTGYFLTAEAAMAQAVQVIAQLAPSHQSLITSVLQGVSSNRGQATLWGLAVLLWSAKNVFLSLEQALNQVWRVPHDRGFIIENLLGIFLALSMGVVFAVLAVAYGAFILLVHYRWPLLGMSAADLPWTLPVIVEVLPAVLSVLSLTFLYTYLPNLPLRFQAMLPGAFVATALWEILRRLFGFYLDHLVRYDMIYGPLGSLVGFLFWIYISASLVLFGAEVNRQVVPAARRSDGQSTANWNE